MPTAGTLTFALGERVEIDSRYADVVVALLAARDTRASISAGEKIAYELTVEPDMRADITLAVAERAELLHVLEEINPNRTDVDFAALELALRQPTTEAA